MVWFTFAYIILLVEGERGVSALKASKEYVKGHWWAVFFRLLFLVLVAIIVGVIFGAVGGVIRVLTSSDMAGDLVMQLQNFIILPLTFAYVYFMYRNLKEIRDNETVIIVPLNN
jgi:hypothetical protein